MPVTMKTDGDKVQLIPEGEGAKPIELTTAELLAKVQAADADILEREVTLTVDGQPRRAFVRDLLKDAEKVGGADARFQQAAASIRVVDLLRKVREAPTEVGEAEYGEVMATLGIVGQERDTLMDVFQKVRENPDALNTTGEEVAGASGAAGKVDPSAARIAALEAQVKTLTGAQSSHDMREQAKGVRARIEDSIRKSLTEDQILGKIIVDEASGKPPTWSNTETFAGSFFDEMITLVRSRITENPERPVTPDEIKGMAGKIRHRLNLVGKALDPEQASKPTALGQALGISPGFQTDEPVQRVGVTNPKHRQNFTDRMLALYQRVSGKGTAG